MMEFDLSPAASACLWGTVQVAIGIAIGMWLRRRNAAAAGDEHCELQRAHAIANKLRQLTDDVTSIVGEHRTQVHDAIERLASTPYRDEHSFADLVVDVVNNVVRANHSLHTRLTSAESRLQEQATEIEAHISRSLTDALTGLPNRRRFDEQLETQIAACRRYGETFSILLIDVDYFKRLNDQYGHPVGDRMLTAVGEALGDGLRADDMVARYGGEEFVVLLPHTTLQLGIVVARKLSAAVANTKVEEKGEPLTVTVSVGLAMIIPGEEGESLVERADAALYAAKAAGRNCVFYHDGLECLPSANLAVPKAPTATPATPIVDGLNVTKTAADAQFNLLMAAQPKDDVLSADLEKLCDDLRRCLAARQRPS